MDGVDDSRISRRRLHPFGYNEEVVIDIYELLPSFIFNVILVIVVSLLTKEPEKEISDEFDAVVKSAK